MLRVPYLGILRKALGSMLPYAAVIARSGCRAAKASKKGACGPGAVPTVERVLGEANYFQLSNVPAKSNPFVTDYQSTL
jgi:hypothetical protein